jgi:hypothetical protein
MYRRISRGREVPELYIRTLFSTVLKKSIRSYVHILHKCVRLASDEL